MYECINWISILEINFISYFLYSNLSKFRLKIFHENNTNLSFPSLKLAPNGRKKKERKKK